MRTPSLCVPLYVNDATWESDFGRIDSATRSLPEYLIRGTLVSYDLSWIMGSVEAAEMAKPSETIYRDANIRLANQFAVFADSAGLKCTR